MDHAKAKGIKQRGDKQEARNKVKLAKSAVKPHSYTIE
ncbi:hypothetical protein KT99_01142 [Shewanella benthica KT99]|uniref:Uncharacterized protein n=1 Tax=Shewanella benthica KT99 TaxID=314608 RepID=A9EIP7_9GAMM|nr:hypothetical protein KT99_01142 [Shewanella benthica KT99]